MLSIGGQNVLGECSHDSDILLPQGSVVDGCIQCPYHGWEYDGSGNCTRMPSTAFCKGIRVSSLPVCEADGFVWVWPGENLPDAAVPAVTQPPEGFDVSPRSERFSSSFACNMRDCFASA